MDARPAEAADLPRAADVLARAFATDAPMGWFIPDARRRVPVLRRWFTAVLAGPWQPWVTDDGTGAALWLAPPRMRPTGRERLRVEGASLRAFGRWPVRGRRGSRAIQAGWPTQPHTLLEFIGVDPGHWGNGAGSALLRAGLARHSTAAGLPAYLDAGSPASRRLYERHGFRVLEEYRLPMDGPTLWRMWREPDGPA